MSQAVSNNHRNLEIEVLRAVAVMFVIIHHYPALLGTPDPGIYRWVEGLWSGVDLFFCISGYVIARGLLPVLASARGAEFWVEVVRFWIRRWYRIIPAAWLWIAALGIVNYSLVLHGDRVFFSDAISAVLHYANLHFYSCTVGFSNACQHLHMYWSLSLEEQFYLLLPISIWVFRKWFPLFIALVIAFQLPVARDHWSGLLSFIRTDAIAFGVLLAVYKESRFLKGVEPGILGKIRFPVLAIGLVAALVLMKPLGWTRNPVGFAAVASMLLVWLASYEKGYVLPDGWLRKALQKVAARSFSLYLGHIVAFALARRWVMRLWPSVSDASFLGGLVFVLVGGLVLFLLVELSYRWVEAPWRRKGHAVADRFSGFGPARALQ
ncbi:acyltransferase family protein [Paracidovorax anthurii]|uniref:Peptidoglycan/LPS O-acetylase OafA/YrhL n=1 Tax=Paracidovorax anthurii TaxID=78229 RepID=A0A328ZLV0_9BURK|nr:acyltransferase [Paracidovorax anthurii]RAR85652.1 peptidoglycan/LPS O-acetylase OafA/YrhL [Paracidovorax anthurii]